MASTKDTRDMTTREVLSEATRTNDQNTDTVKRALQIAEDTREVQASTLEALNVQGKQMHRIGGDLVEVEEGVDEAEEILETMACCSCLRPRRPAPKRRPRPKHVQSVPSQSQRAVEDVGAENRAVQQRVGGKEEESGRGRVQRRETNHGTNGGDGEVYTEIREQQNLQDDYLSQIDQTLNAIKQGAQDMNVELNNQSRAMSGIQQQTENAESRVGDVQRNPVMRRNVRNPGDL